MAEQNLQRLTVTLDFKNSCGQPTTQVHFVTEVLFLPKSDALSLEGKPPFELVGVTPNGTVCFPWEKVLSYELEDIDPMALCPKCNSHVTAGIGERFCLMCGHEWKDTEEAGEHENRVG